MSTSSSTIKFKPRPGLRIEVPKKNNEESTTISLSSKRVRCETITNEPEKNIPDVKENLTTYINEIKNENYNNLNEYVKSAFTFLQVHKPKFSENDDDIKLRDEIIEINKKIPLDNIKNEKIICKFEAMKKGLPNTFGGKKYKKTRKHSKKHRKSKRKSRKNKRKY
jgi:hypothetical protein